MGLNTTKIKALFLLPYIYLFILSSPVSAKPSNADALLFNPRLTEGRCLFILSKVSLIGHAPEPPLVSIPFYSELLRVLEENHRQTEKTLAASPAAIIDQSKLYWQLPEGGFDPKAYPEMDKASFITLQNLVTKTRRDRVASEVSLLKTLLLAEGDIPELENYFRKEAHGYELAVELEMEGHLQELDAALAEFQTKRGDVNPDNVNIRSFMGQHPSIRSIVPVESLWGGASLNLIKQTVNASIANRMLTTSFNGVKGDGGDLREQVGAHVIDELIKETEISREHWAHLDDLSEGRAYGAEQAATRCPKNKGDDLYRLYIRWGNVAEFYTKVMHFARAQRGLARLNILLLSQANDELSLTFQKLSDEEKRSRREEIDHEVSRILDAVNRYSILELNPHASGEVFKEEQYLLAAPKGF